MTLKFVLLLQYIVTVQFEKKTLIQSSTNKQTNNMTQTMLEFEGCPDEGVLHHVIQESLEERIRAYRLRVADDS